MKDIRKRFMSKIELIPFHTCWEWIAALDGRGYGKMLIGSRTDGSRKYKIAHRLSYELFVGPIPEDHVVMHKCDNTSCVNPDHLMVGTLKDNTRDMIHKGRSGLKQHLKKPK